MPPQTPGAALPSAPSHHRPWALPVVAIGALLLGGLLAWQTGTSPAWAVLPVLAAALQRQRSRTRQLDAVLDQRERALAQARGSAAATAAELERRSDEFEHQLAEITGGARETARAAGELGRMLDHSPCAYVSLDEQGTITRVNATALAWFNRDSGEVLGRLKLSEFLTTDAHRRWQQALAATPPGADTPSIEGVLRGRQIAPRWVRLSSRNECRDDGSACRTHAVMFDITRQRDAERGMQQVNEQQRAIIDSDLLGMARVRNRTVVWVSSGMTHMFGHTREHMTGAATREFFAYEEDYLEMGLRAYGELRERGSYRGEVPMVHADQHRMWMELRAITFDPTGEETLWLFTDISARRDAEEALRASRSFLARTGTVAGVGGFEIDVASGDVKWTDETCRLHDVEPGTTLTLEVFLEFHAPEGRAVIEQAVDEATRFGAGWDLELPMVSASGRRFWARTVGTAELQNGRVVRLVGALQDITVRRRMEHELTASRELLQVTLASIADAVITTDREGRVTWLNAMAETLTGWRIDQAQGHGLAEVYRAIDEDSRAPLADPVARCLREGRIVGLAAHTLLVARGRREHAVEDSVAPIRDEEGQAVGTVLVFRDVTEQRRMAREVQHRATHDALTGLSNRADFEARLAALLEERELGGGEHAVMYIDLDQFKLLNDSCGHLVGDQILRQIAAMFGYSVRSGDLVARLGGDEFGVILRDCDLAQAKRLGEQICSRMDGYRFHFEGRRFRVGSSIGLVSLDGRWRSVSALLEAADLACYAAKEAGRNRVWLWREQDRLGNRHRVVLSWSTRLEQAIEHDGFVLHTQPVMAIDGGREQSWEALLRLREGPAGLALPGGFLPPAGRFHLLPRIDAWVLDAVLERLEAGVEPWGRTATVSINLSAPALADAEFRARFRERLLAAPALAARLCVELSEEAVLTDIEAARSLATEARALGVRVAIDDFGGTTAAFSYLRDFPVDLVKVDRQLCSCLPGTELDRAVLRGCLEVARVAGVVTVAKGIENEAQREAARALGFDQLQGFLCGSPRALASAERMPDNREVCLTPT